MNNNDDYPKWYNGLFEVVCGIIIFAVLIYVKTK